MRVNRKPRSQKLVSHKIVVLSVALVAIFITALLLVNSYLWTVNSGLPASVFARTLYWSILGLYLDTLPTLTLIPITPVPTQLQLASATPTTTAIPTEVPLISKKYVSQNLRISFAYAMEEARQSIFVKEIRDTIYLYHVIGNNPNKPFTGTDTEFLETHAPHSKSVTVFKKDPQQTLVDSIKQQILQGYSENDCIVENAEPYGPFKTDASFQTADIKIPRSPVYISHAQQQELLKKCPEKYMHHGGIRYFLMDPSHPDKLLFFSIGQDTISSGVKGYSWDETIKFL